jgi:ANTAR domain
MPTPPPMQINRNEISSAGANSMSPQCGDMVGDIRMLDMAKGILIALRRYSAEQAFHELVSAAKNHQIGVLTLSQALVGLAESPQHPPHAHSHAKEIAHRLWASLFTATSVKGSRQSLSL